MAINHTNSINRENRKTNARALTLLGFNLNELVDYLGVSSNTVKTYLRETEGVIYNDLEDYIYRDHIFNLFTHNEKDLLNFVRDAKEKVRELSHESNRTHRIAKGKGLMGWIHKKLLKDCDEYDKINKELMKEIKEFHIKINLRLKEFSKKNICPHLSKSIVKFEVILPKKE